MNQQKWLMAGVAFALMAGAGVLLGRLQGSQRLGPPGIQSNPLPGTICRLVLVPDPVLDYQSKWVEPDQVTTNTLPRDTSYGQRMYTAPDGFQISLNTVLMGTDRTSLHKPQFCLVGAGWKIDQTERTFIPITQPRPYNLPVIKLTCSKEIEQEGRRRPMRAIYVYWYVADGALSNDPSGADRMWWMARELMTHGTLQRWAYVSCLTACEPGREAATYQRMEQFLAAAAPGLLTSRVAAAASAAAPDLTATR